MLMLLSTCARITAGICRNRLAAPLGAQLQSLKASAQRAPEVSNNFCLIGVLSKVG